MHTEKTCSLASTKPSTETTTEKSTEHTTATGSASYGASPLMCIECGVGAGVLIDSIPFCAYHGLQYQIKENIKYGKIT